MVNGYRPTPRERSPKISTIDDLLANAEQYARTYHTQALPGSPARRVAVLACMDARINVYALLGLGEGDAHVIRNAGGVVTADGRRSLAISQRLMGTREILLIHHTRCGMLNFTDDGFKAEIQAETGLKPDWSVETFDDAEEDVRQSIRRIIADPFIPYTDNVRGFIFELETGRLREVAG